MLHRAKLLWLSLLLAVLGAGVPRSARADNVCAICGKPIYGGTVWIMTDKVTGEQKEVCSDCIKLPRCYICGMPIKEGGVQLPDGRWLCARDAKTVVLKADDVVQICAEVREDLDRLFSRFTAFPTNVDVNVIDRIDVNSMFNTEGNMFESPDLLGCIHPVTVNGRTRYKMSVLVGMPLAQVKETCAHEYSHAWVGENVPRERRARLGRDAEEGFCELIGYLLMDSQNEDQEKERVLRNHYTRGQINLFLEAEQRYGFDEVLDWMKYGVAPQLEAGHVDELRDVKLPSARPAADNAAGPAPVARSAPKPAPTPAGFKLNGILWGTRPAAIINGCSFSAQDFGKVPFGNTRVMIRCLEIRERSVRIQNMASGTEQELFLPSD